MDLVIGTAQVQGGYGVKDRGQSIGVRELERILDFCRLNSITQIDTSPGYGDAEKKLGYNALHSFDLYTKVSVPLTDAYHVMHSKIRMSIHRSVVDLNVQKIEGVAIHNFEMLTNDMRNMALKALDDLRSELGFQKIGVSIYTTEVLEKNNNLKLVDYVQAPLSFVDQRFLSQKFQNILRDNDISFHARSIFLQGLLLMDVDEQVALFPKFYKIWHRLDSFVQEFGYSKLSLCFNFLNHCQNIEKVVVGVKSLDQLASIHLVKDIMVQPIFSAPVFDDNLLLPFNWKHA